MRNTFSISVFAGFLALMFLSSCSSSPRPISLALSPASASTDQGYTVRLTATLTNDSSSRGVIWTLNGPGTLSPQTGTSVTYLAPALSNNRTVQTATVTATSVADSTKTASAQITVNPPPLITSSMLPQGTAGSGYSQIVTESGGTQPFVWSIDYGAIPPGLNIESDSGTISGTPTQAGTWYFEVRLADAVGMMSQQPFLSVEIASNAAPGNPVPFLYQPLVPDTVSPGASAFTLALNGTGFLPTSTVNFNGTPLTTTYINQGQIAAVVPASLVATPGTATITVSSPTPGGGTSNFVYFPVATPEASVAFSDAAGSPITTIYGPISTAVGDFTGKGKTDLAVAQNGPKVYVFLGNGDGTFNQASGSPMVIQQPPWDTLPTPYMSFVTTGNLDNSGNLSLAVTNSTDSDISILLGKGDGTFTPSSAFVYTVGGRVQSLALGDFTGSGNLDIAVANQIGGVAVNVLLGYQDGAFNEAFVPITQYVLNAYMPAVGDFNRDGKLDLAVTGAGVAAAQDDQVNILIGNGDGTFTVPPVSGFTSGAAPEAIVVADFNGDGKLDLAITNYQDATVAILLGNGNGVFTQATASPITVGNGPDAIVTADLNGDGKLDLAVANYLDNTLTILLGNGDGTFTPASSSPISVGAGPSSIAVGDFNSSGRLGVAVTSLSGNTVSILVQQP